MCKTSYILSPLLCNTHLSLSVSKEPYIWPKEPSISEKSPKFTHKSSYILSSLLCQHIWGACDKVHVGSLGMSKEPYNWAKGPYI